MLKTPLEKVIGSSIHTWVAPADQKPFQALLKGNGQQSRRAEIGLCASDGTLTPAYLSVNAPQAEDMPISFCLVATELTEQKRSEANLATEKLVQELLAASNQSRLLLSVIEDQKRAEEALIRSERMLNEAQRIAGLGSWEWDILANKTRMVQKPHPAKICSTR